MAQQLQVCIAHAEDLTLVLSIHVSSGHPMPLVSMGTFTHRHMYPRLHEYVIKNKINKKKSQNNS